ncbi:ATP-grasp domain-containing protein [Antribacter gilvus]|uniref:ATP-grasp domain-containing protein n=1 Tax=Antribacter gilvus TaxID=2304675 RepID=UPI000F777686|nr:ATP-grasp domain-containing protein [Antribacter gilvus]
MSDDGGFLLCCDPLEPRAADPHFGREATALAARDVAVGLVDHDALVSGDAHAAVRRVPRDLGRCWYRGWMVPATAYERLSGALAGRGAELVVPPPRFRAAHELPGWYEAFAEVTPESVWSTWEAGRVPAPDDVARLVAPLGGGPGVVKDYVKSRKHEWREACFVPDLADSGRATAVIARMVELQGTDLAGGIVVRRFEELLGEGRPAEARVWWVDGEPVLVGPHPDTPEVHVAPDLSQVLPAVLRLGCRFVTTDVAQRSDGTWRVVEVGDGQVSDLPADGAVEKVLGALLEAAKLPV